MTNQSDKLCRLSGIKAVVKGYPDFTKPSNFVKLLVCLHKVGLTVSFFRSEISTIEYCCEIEDCYMYENRPDFEELFCEKNKNNYQSALVDTLINIYEREWICGMSDKHFFYEFEETLTELQHQAQQTEWEY